jgi:hypothetical protein
MAYKLVGGEKPELICVLKGAVERVLPAARMFATSRLMRPSSPRS